MSYRESIEKLKRVHRGQTLKLAVTRLAWVLLAGGLTLGAGDLLFLFPDEVRFGLGLALLLLFVVVGLLAYLRERRAKSLERMVVRLLEEENPEIENLLVNAVDFEEVLKKGPRAEISSELMRREIERAAEKIDRIPSRKALLPRTFWYERMGLWGLLAVSILALCFVPTVFLAIAPRLLDPFGDHPPYSRTRLTVDPAGASIEFGGNLKVTVEASGELPEKVELAVRDPATGKVEGYPMFHEADGRFFLTLEKLENDLEYFARIDRGRSKRYSLEVDRIPRFGDIVATFHPPTYTRLESTTRLLVEPNELRGYTGTKVEVAVSSNRPLSGGEISVEGKVYPFAPAAANQVSATCVLETEGTFSLLIVDTEGNKSVDRVTGKVTLIPDEPPEVLFERPGIDSFAVPDFRVPLEIEAMDDLGITRITLFRNHNGSEDDRKVLYESDGSEKLVLVTETLDLADLGVRPGDTIEYYAMATDSRPENPQSTSTQTFVLKIISFEEYQEFVQSQTTAEQFKEKYEAVRREMEDLASAQANVEEAVQKLKDDMAAAGQTTPEDLENLTEAEQRQRDLAEWAKDLSDRLKEESEKRAVFDIEEDYKKALAEYSERLSKAAEHMEEAQNRMAEASKSPENQPPSPGSMTPSLNLAAESQRKAQKALQESAEDFEKEISEPNENLENVANVIADTEKFKYLYTLQKGLERQIRFFREKSNPDLDDRIRLKELSEQQAEVRGALEGLKEEIRSHAAELDELAETKKSPDAQVGPEGIVPESDRKDDAND